MSNDPLWNALLIDTTDICKEVMCEQVVHEDPQFSDVWDDVWEPPDTEPTYLLCKNCGEYKEVHEFPVDSYALPHRLGKKYLCRECYNKKHSVWQKARRKRLKEARKI